MTDKDIKTIAADLDSLHMKILNHKFAEVVSENEILSLVSAIKVIDRQRAEIERLKEENKKLNLMVESIDDYMNPLPFKTDFDNAIETAKSEAVKEFSKSLIDKTHGGKISSTDILDFAVDYLRGENNG